MTAEKHLWPARVEYLRRGCFVLAGPYDERAIVRWLDGDHVNLFGIRPGCKRMPAHRLHIDLRDPTTRAHAAMAYTRVDHMAIVHVGAKGSHEWHIVHGRVLCRMRAMDESVTVDEARDALAWAEGLADGEVNNG